MAVKLSNIRVNALNYLTLMTQARHKYDVHSAHFQLLIKSNEGKCVKPSCASIQMHKKMWHIYMGRKPAEKNT